MIKLLEFGIINRKYINLVSIVKSMEFLSHLIHYTLHVLAMMDK